MEHRHDGLIFIESHHAVGGGHGVSYPLGQDFVLVTPLGLGLLLAQVGAATAGVVAHVRLGMAGLAAGANLIENIGALRHRLGRQGRRLKGGQHLPLHHAGQVLRHGHGLHRVANQHPEGHLRVMQAHGGRFLRRGGGGGGDRRVGLHLLIGRGALPGVEPGEGKEKGRQRQAHGDALFHILSHPFLPPLYEKGRMEKDKACRRRKRIFARYLIFI